MVIVFSLQAGGLAAGEPPREPMLRIETSSHTSAIPANGIASRGRITVTASHDKTARVWDTATGKLLNILRPPVGLGLEGILASVALSPDARLVALGGATGYSWDGQDSVYVFDRLSGQIVVRLGNQPNTIPSLAWSHDGRWLAVGLKSGGLRLYDTKTWKLVGSDPNYYGSVSSLEFLQDGRLVAAALDGILRIYSVGSGSLQRDQNRDFGRGTQLLKARTSPDGQRIAVAHQGGEQDFITIVRTDDITGEAGNLPIPTPRPQLFGATSTSQIQNRILALGWSATGDKLYASLSITAVAEGGVWTLRQQVVRDFIWAWDTHDWQLRKTAAAPTQVTAVTPAADGKSLVGADDGSLYALDQFMAGDDLDTRDISKRWMEVKGVVSLRHSHHRISVAEGKAKELCVNRFPICFSTGNRAFIPNAQHALKGFRAASRSNSTGNVTVGTTFFRDGKDIVPVINGRHIEIPQGETVYSAHVFGDGLGVVVGTNRGNLRIFSSRGEPLRVIATPTSIIAVNASADGKIVIAAIGDGTIRWYNAATGKELLGLFLATLPGRDSKTLDSGWIMWTPTGYYDASVGGEKLIGWHVNRGAHQAADFHPISHFRDKYYRPDIVAKVLDTLDEAEAIRQANAEAGRTVPQQVADTLPPAISILSPEDGAELAAGTAALRMAIRTPSGAPLTHLSVRVNGKVVQVAEGKNFQIEPAEGIAREIDVPLEAGPNEITVMAGNRHGASVPKILNVNTRAPRASATVSSKPVLRVLAVGVSQYSNPAHNLQFAAKDAEDFVAALGTQKGRLYREVDARVIRSPTRETLREGLAWLRSEAKPGEVSVLYLSGHGFRNRAGKYFFATAEADPKNTEGSMLPYEDIRDTLSAIANTIGQQAGRVMAFVDTCHAGAVLGSGLARDASFMPNDLASPENGIIVFSSSTGGQLSYEDAAWQNSAFTKALAEGLRGRPGAPEPDAALGGMLDAFRKSGRITSKMLDTYVSERVEKLTAQRQTPKLIAPFGLTNFPMADLQ